MIDLTKNGAGEIYSKEDYLPSMELSMEE